MMKVVFMGTPEFAVPTLNALIDEGYDVSMVITQPDKRGNRNKIISSPVKLCALEHNINVRQPARLTDDTALIDEIGNYEPDFIVVAAFGQILPKEILEIPKYCCLNVHASLLPKYRGASPMQMAIINNESISGVSIMRMDEGLDTGDVVLQRTCDIKGKNILEVSKMMENEGTKALIKVIDDIVLGNANYKKQDDEESTYTHIIKKKDGLTDFNESADKIEAKMRAYYDWPTLHSFLNGVLYKFYGAEIIDEGAKNDAGTIDSVSKDCFVINCADKKIKILDLQVQGKKRMNVADFIRGNKLSIGDRFTKE